jgi:hypothetical protein
VAFPSWFLRIKSDRFHKEQWANQVHMPRSDLPLRVTLDFLLVAAGMRHIGRT